MPMRSKSGECALWGLPMEGVDIHAASVAQHQGEIVGSES